MGGQVAGIVDVVVECIRGAIDPAFLRLVLAVVIVLLKHHPLCQGFLEQTGFLVVQLFCDVAGVHLFL
ncbi:hypothetical protein D3C73_1558070 [compost metagenome]